MIERRHYGITLGVIVALAVLAALLAVKVTTPSRCHHNAIGEWCSYGPIKGGPR